VKIIDLIDLSEYTNGTTGFLLQAHIHIRTKVVLRVRHMICLKHVMPLVQSKQDHGTRSGIERKQY